MHDKQSKKQFLSALIREYFQAELRTVIYPKERDKEFYAKVADLKRQKIEDLCVDINVPNPFEDDELLNQYRTEIGHVLTTKEDRKHYFIDQASVRVKHQGVYTEGTIESREGNKVIVLCDQGEIKVPQRAVTRIL